MTLPLSHLFFPSHEPSKKLIVVLHGRGDSAEGFRFFPQELGFTDINFLLLNAPTESYPGYSWYDFPPNQREGIHSSSALLTQTFDMLFEEGYDPKQTILFGFSQGSLLTFEFGSRYKKALAGYMAISGYIYDASKILEQMNPQVNQNNWFCSHGYEDEVLAFSQSQSQVQTLIDGGFDIDFHAYHKTHTIAMQELQDIKAWIRSKI
ncbi:MAG: serine esterase [Thiovulaceae bacterium]|nr:serine esterase [Sulfurimonadaceae bacterium]